MIRLPEIKVDVLNIHPRSPAHCSTSQLQFAAHYASQRQHLDGVISAVYQDLVTSFSHFHPKLILGLSLTKRRSQVSTEVPMS